MGGTYCAKVKKYPAAVDFKGKIYYNIAVGGSAANNRSKEKMSC